MDDHGGRTLFMGGAGAKHRTMVVTRIMILEVTAPMVILCMIILVQFDAPAPRVKLATPITLRVTTDGSVLRTNTTDEKDINQLIIYFMYLSV
ncbi:MAG: hypothetical protein ACOY93_04895 [Bacillota bacterium]